MTHSSRCTSARALPLLPLLLSGLLLTACSDNSSEAAVDSGSSPTSAEDQQLAFARCMRENGLPDFPDPENGHLVMGGETGVEPGSPEFEKAKEACKDVAPAGPGGDDGGEPLDSAKVAAWADCIRNNGVPEFADPKVDGSSMVVDFAASGIDPESAGLQDAMDACTDKYPGGNLKMKDGGPR